MLAERARLRTSSSGCPDGRPFGLGQLACVIDGFCHYYRRIVGVPPANLKNRSERTMAGPQAVQWGWQTPSPSRAMIEAAAWDVWPVMQANGWQWNDITVTHNLNQVIADLGEDYDQNLATHVTIKTEDFYAAMKLALQQGAATTDAARSYLRTVLYHVTVEAGPAGAEGNPRWWSDRDIWTPADSGAPGNDDCTAATWEGDALIKAL